MTVPKRRRRASAGSQSPSEVDLMEEAGKVREAEAQSVMEAAKEKAYGENDNIMSLRDLRKEEEADNFALSDDIELEGVDTLEPEIEQEFETYSPPGRNKRVYDQLVVQDRPVRKQAFNVLGKEIDEWETMDDEEKPKRVIPVRDNVIAACSKEEQKTKQNDAEQAEALRLEVRRMREQMIADRLKTINNQTMNANKALMEEQKRRARALRQGIL